MNLRQASTLAIFPIAFAAIGPTYSEGYSDLLRQRGNESAPTVVLRTSDLRSAYLIRSGQVRYDASDTTPAGLRRQLQRHFDTVVAFLLLNTPDSIEVALDRLQTEQRASWSTADREAWRDRLIASRRALIIRLVDYRNRGQFPRNEGRAAAPVPIFVDNHNIACAVGHLMRISHRERDVAGIQRESNLVYVPDVTAGPLVAWTLTSGITLEEAALIQPAYGPVLLPKPDDAIEVLNSDATFEFENLRYSKFQIFAGDDPTSPSVNIPVTHQACSWFGCGITFPIIWDADLSRDLTLVPDFELLVRDVTSSELQPNPPLLSSFPRVVVQFDVEVTAPNLRITQLPGGGSLLSNSYFDGRQFRLFVNDCAIVCGSINVTIQPQHVQPRSARNLALDCRK